MKNIITILLLICTLSVSAQQKLHVDKTNGQSLVYDMSAVRQLNVSTDYKDLIIQMKNGSKVQESIHNVDKFYFTQEKLIGIWEATSQSDINMTYVFFDNNMCSYYENGYNRAEEGIPYSFSDGKLIIDGKEIDYTLDGDNLSFTYGYSTFVGKRVYTVDDETEQQYRDMLKGTWKGTKEDYYSPHNVLFRLLEDGTFQQIEDGAVEFNGNWAVCGNKVMITEPLNKSDLGSTWTIISLTTDRMVLVDAYGYKMDVEKYTMTDPVIENAMTIDGKKFAIETVEAKQYDDKVKLEFGNRTNRIYCMLDFDGHYIPIGNKIALRRLEIEDEAEHKLSGGAYDGTAYADVLQNGNVFTVIVDNQVIEDSENKTRHVVSLSYIFK